MTDDFWKKSIIFRDTRDHQEHDTKTRLSIPSPSPEKPVAEIGQFKKTDLSLKPFKKNNRESFRQIRDNVALDDLIPNRLFDLNTFTPRMIRYKYKNYKLTWLNQAEMVILDCIHHFYR